ncbi:MAG: ABC transporter ATP-binding protein [Dehalococcoidia bacterium]|jgi:branched-chain amino acid transport system ATP-binding protein|nr:ABC transporter ATP-binding protein [Dehalococcoidia bacterium]MDW8009733.1 ABC transporter ATP-binding protein [Chloroflexota bacterium]
MLAVRDLYAGYGNVTVLKGLNFDVPAGSIVALLGANGAGKTTTLRVISGMIRPSRGQVMYDGQSLVGLPAHALVKRGIVHVPEGRRIFAGLTVEENLLLGAFTRPWDQRTRESLEQVYAYFPRLKERRRQLGGTLSGGEQQMLAIGRAFMANPRFLLLDEPSLGLAPAIVNELYESIVRLNKEQGLTILFVEQNAALALDVAQFAYVLEVGSIVLGGPSGDLKDNEEVKRVYLGY